MEAMEPDFKKIVREAKGLMSEEDYRELYHEAIKIGKGTIVEIGPARGAGTIVLGLAARQNSDIEHIITIDSFQNSRSIKSFDNIEENIEDLRNNLAAFDCGEKVTIMVAGHEDWELIRECPITMLVIDADGALDRDFSNYYNLLTPGARVFVDDCEAKLNSHVRLYYTRERTGYTDNPEEDAGGYLEKISPLGKECMTRCFIDYLIREGFLKVLSKGNKAITFKKSEPSLLFSETNLTEMQQIRERMKEELIAIRSKTMRIAGRLHPQLQEIQEKTGCEEILVMKGVPMDRDIRYYPIYGIGKDGKRASDIGRIYEKDIHKSSYGDKQVLLLKTRRLLKKDKYALVISGLPDQESCSIPPEWKRSLVSALDAVETETQKLFKSLELSSL